MELNSFQKKLQSRKGYKVCMNCGHERVVEDFVSGSLSNPKIAMDCAECRGLASREKEVIERERAAAKLIRSAVKSSRAAKYDVTKVYEFATELMNQFGGLESACAQWKAQIDRACQLENPKAALDSFYAMFKMHVEASKEIAAVTDTAGMSDDEVDAELRRIMEEELKELSLYDGESDVA